MLEVRNILGFFVVVVLGYSTLWLRMCKNTVHWKKGNNLKVTKAFVKTWPKSVQHSNWNPLLYLGGKGRHHQKSVFCQPLSKALQACSVWDVNIVGMDWDGLDCIVVQPNYHRLTEKCSAKRRDWEAMQCLPLINFHHQDMSLKLQKLAVFLTHHP